MKKQRPKKKQKSREQVSGDGWAMWVADDGYPFWEESGDPDKIRNMVQSEFPPHLVDERYVDQFVVTHGNRLGPLYEHVVEFLESWGIKASTNAKYGGETGPFD